MSEPPHRKKAILGCDASVETGLGKKRVEEELCQERAAQVLHAPQGNEYFPVQSRSSSNFLLPCSRLDP